MNFLIGNNMTAYKTPIRTLRKQAVKEEVRRMRKYNIDKLNDLAEQSGIPLITINYFWNVIHCDNR